MKPTRIALFFRNDNKKAGAWVKRLEHHLSKVHPNVVITNEKPQFVIALGGDGTILEAARTYRLKPAPIIVGFNLGHVGFLASARRPNEFLPAMDRLLEGKFAVLSRMLLAGKIYRKGRLIMTTDALNEIAIQSLLGAIKLTVFIDSHPLQYIHGNGVMIATPTGSTAYNLSAHGPIVTPDIHCFIITEILDHHIPTPSIVVKRTKTIEVLITEVRKRGLLAIAKTGEPADVVFTSDDMGVFPLEEGDRIEIAQSKHIVKFAEFEEGYFIKSLQEKFAFR